LFDAYRGVRECLMCSSTLCFALPIAVPLCDSCSVRTVRFSSRGQSLMNVMILESMKRCSSPVH
jgi:hypothetical protein